MLWGVLTQVDKDFNYLAIWIWISKMPPQTLNLSLKPVRKKKHVENKEVIHEFV